MKLIFAALMGLGVVAALCASLLVASLHVNAKDQVKSGKAAPKNVEFIVAARSMPAMTVVDASAVSAHMAPEDELPPGTIKSSSKVIGQVLVAPMVEGQPFTTNLLAANRPGMHLSAILPEGMRAVSVVLSPASGLHGLLYPGSLVDIVAAFSVQSNNKDEPGTRIFSTVLLQGIEVLAVGGESVVAAAQTSEEATSVMDDRRRQTVTVMVDAKQSEILQLAMTHGEISLAMRNPLDMSRALDSGVLLADISGGLINRLDSGVAPPPLVPTSNPRSEWMRPVPLIETPTAPLPHIDGTDGRPGDRATQPTSKTEETPVWKVLLLRGTKRDIYEFPMPVASAEPE